MHSLDPKGAINNSEVTRGYTSVMATLKFTTSDYKDNVFFFNCVTSVIGDMFI